MSWCFINQIKKHDLTLSVSNERVVSFPSWLVIGRRRIGGMKKERIKRHDIGQAQRLEWKQWLLRVLMMGVLEVEIPEKLPAMSGQLWVWSSASGAPC